jgi:hypothetical protein
LNLRAQNVNNGGKSRVFDRDSTWSSPTDPANGTAIGDPMVGQTDPIVVLPVAKVVYVHSSLAPPVLHWRQDEGAYADLPMEDAGPLPPHLRTRCGLVSARGYAP